jgi:aminoglycoside phosphotransferase (APT) family kinase protein
MTLAVAALADRVAAAFPAQPVGPLEVLAGGHSGLTYVVTVGYQRYVVKAVPPAERPVGRNDMLRQAQVLRALAGSAVPVPAVAVVDDRPPAWFAMEFINGEAIEPVLDEHELPADLVRDRMFDAVRVLRRLHQVDLSTVDLGAPAPRSAVGELEQWRRTMHAVPEELRPGAEELLRRLAEHVPDDHPPSLLHGDFRLGNMLYSGLRAAAVVDWEIWSVGDARIDLGWFLLFADHRNFPALGTAVSGLPAPTELLASYVDGRPPPAMDWFHALNRMKMAAIMGHNLRRHREGRIHDPDQERLPPTIAAMITTACDLLA